MPITKFEDLIAWQKAQALASEIYAEFQLLKDFSFKDQICKAVVSISNNIAEGFDRASKAEFPRFLWYAQGSCSEVKSMLYLSERLALTSKANIERLIQLVSEVSRLINGLIKSLR